MKNYFDVIIVGGGASGLFCACEIKQSTPDLKVAILEKQDRIGKKLLSTGNGRCNLTNTEAKENMYHGSFSFAVKDMLNIYSPMVIIEKFLKMGLITTVDEAGRVYPLSKQSNSVLDTLRINLRKQNVDIITDCEVTNITKTKGLFSLKSKTEIYTCRQLVIATGSKATPSLGSDSNMLNILTRLGHNVNLLTPALCPVNVNSPYIKSLKGIRANGKVRLIQENRVLKEEVGEIQFSENALSGICVFNLSGLANTRKNTKISVSLLPQYSSEDVYNIIKSKQEMLPIGAKAEELFIGIFHKMIGVALLKECGISPSAEVKDLDKQCLIHLCEIINDWRFTVIPSDDFKKAQVAAGGIYGKEIDSKTMESRLHNGLYLLGEIIDIYGDCGGLNLHFAFMSASAAAKRICEIC